MNLATRVSVHDESKSSCQWQPWPLTVNAEAGINITGYLHESGTGVDTVSSACSTALEIDAFGNTFILCHPSLESVHLVLLASIVSFRIKFNDINSQ